MVKLKTIVLLCLLLMFGKPLYAYTGFAYSVPLTMGGEYQREGYRVDLGLYPIGESPFLISAGFSEYQTSEKNYESVHIKGIHLPIYYVLIGHSDGSLKDGAILFGLNSSYWYSVDLKLRDERYGPFFNNRSRHKYQFSGYIFKAVFDRGDSFSVFLWGSSKYDWGPRSHHSIIDPTSSRISFLGFGYYFK